MNLAFDGLTDDQRVVRKNEGPHGQPVDGRGGDDAHVLDAGQRQLKGAGDGRGGQGEDVDIAAQLLETFLMGDTEMLFFVDHQEAEIGESDRGGEKRVGADDDIDPARLKAFLDLRRRRWRDQPGELGDLDG